MSVVSDYEPKAALRFFEEISSIPHGSGNTKKISDYLVKFAKDRNLKYIQDEANNVIIWKDGSKGYENSLPVIIQGHMDMVCEKAEDCNIDFENDGLELVVEDGVLSANGTTLGGDDGIAVAFALAILDETSLAHPPIEAVFTVDEEIGMLGAAALDMSVLKGRTMINIDSEDEQILLVSCAGGATAKCILPLERVIKKGVVYNIEISGLLGGHSGSEIDKGRASSNQLMGRVLYYLSKKADYDLICVNGGLKDNAIPRKTSADVMLTKKTDVKSLVSEIEDIIKKEYAVTDAGIVISVIEKGESEQSVMSNKTGKDVISALFTLPCGIQRMSRDIEGLVQTSLNMGILTTSDSEVIMSFSVRSAVMSEKVELIDKLEAEMDIRDGKVIVEGDYPAWEYKIESRLRDIMTKVYKKEYGKEPRIEAIHAGLECGLFSGALEGLDCVAIGPDIIDIHTYSERVAIASINRSWNYLTAVLKELK